MIEPGKVFDASRLPLPLRLETDLCVVGSGAGGAMVAMVAAEAGLEVLLLEAGELVGWKEMTQREEQMFPRLFWDGASRTTEDKAVKIHQGKGVGGSTLHNLNLCKRIPAAIFERWASERGLAHLPWSRWESLYSEVEALLGVSEVPREQWNRHNHLLEEGCQALGWRGGSLRHNRSGCLGSGFCELGCAYDAKNNAARVLLPRVLAAGGEVLTLCQAVRVEHRGGKVRGVRAVAVEPHSRRPLGEVEVSAKRVCLSASATGTAALLLRSGVPDPSGETGNCLRIHPAVVAAGDFEEEVRAWQGIPQAYECTELLELEQPTGHRAWVLPAFAHPVGAATMVPGQGQEHRELMKRYAHLAVFTAMIHDRTQGRVRPRGELGLSIDYWPSEEDRRELSLGLWGCAKLLFAAGARRVFIPTFPGRVLERGDSPEWLRELPIERGRIDLVAVHPMSSVPMGDDPQQAAVDSQGRHHHLEGLFVADASLFPTSIGGPPQLSVYAIGLQVGRVIARG